MIMLYQHIRVADEQLYEVDLSICNYTRNYVILATLRCPSSLNKNPTCPCSSDPNAMLEIHIIGRIKKYKFQTNKSGLLESEVDRIDNDTIERNIDHYFRDLWGFKNIVHDWKKY